MKLATAQQMQQCDKIAMEEYKIPGLVLMENAGRGTVEAMVGFFGELADKVVTVLVGPGNNGGDGLVIARHLYQLGGVPRVVCLVEPEKLQGDAAANLLLVRKLPIPFELCLNEDALAPAEKYMAESDIVVDALFGTGLARNLTGRFAEVVERLNGLNKKVVAVDIPSGLNSDTGKPMGGSVQATLTCTYGLAKPGQVLETGPFHVGTLRVIDIGIPAEVVGQVGVNWELLEQESVAQWLPIRGRAAHKGTFGHLLVVAGSMGKSGAALLCGLGALRSGVGLVTLCAPSGLLPVFESTILEAMCLPVKGASDFLSDVDYEEIVKASTDKKGVAIGPGLGQHPRTASLIEKLYKNIPQPMVIDADGLNLLARDVTILKDAAGVRVLTPHPGEMARLTGLSITEIQENRQQVAGEFAEKHHICLVLKGAETVIAASDGRLAINPTGNSGMATGGMGDVLTGLIGALIAQGVPAWQAACLGAYVHGRAADRLCRLGEMRFGYLAREVADELPPAFGELHEVLELQAGLGVK
jgi:NAD(P)H-hydrate epimerase